MFIDHRLKPFDLMVAWPPSVPTTVVILVVDYISELPFIHYMYTLCKGNVHFIYSELDTADCSQLVEKNDLEIVL